MNPLLIIVTSTQMCIVSTVPGRHIIVLWWACIVLIQYSLTRSCNCHKVGFGHKIIRKSNPTIQEDWVSWNYITARACKHQYHITLRVEIQNDHFFSEGGNNSTPKLAEGRGACSPRKFSSLRLLLRSYTAKVAAYKLCDKLQ